ncbi:far upstream element-binding protein 2-like isoform X1 [Sinocyclocheilus grahami]|uniref:far upstream element-binding protein 2-like isoform X1 n=2 Tax=Sinocyclocheilus grahami TaxID=75366 RepID=UPI0007ACC489|nr:PREDICTED: far upstream element-binding protein 2-like isoform X1 [Sinocyclocheilus grahami]
MSEYSSVPPLGAGGLKKDAFADAVQRARQIAAKIGGDVTGPPMSNNGGAESFPFAAQKRSLEDGDQPESKKMASDRDNGSALSIGAQLAALSQQSVRPSSITEEYRVPDGMVGLILEENQSSSLLNTSADGTPAESSSSCGSMRERESDGDVRSKSAERQGLFHAQLEQTTTVIGRGGEQINKIQQESGCKVQIAPESGGLPDRIVSLTGGPEAIQKAKMQLDDIISRGRGTPPSFHESTNGSGHMQEMVIPAGKAGLIIGKGGETIKQLQERAGVKMILIQDASQGPNMDKPLRIIGDPYKVQQAREMVQEILRERDHPGFDRNEYGSQIGGGIEVPVPRHSVGVVIGRSGEMIKKIQNDAGVRIQFKPDDGSGPDKIAHVMGPPDRCEHAASIINDLLQSIRVREEGGEGPPGPPGTGMPPGGRGRGHGPGNWGPPGGEMTFSIPAHKCGLVIGRGGENVKAINQQTGAFVEISRQPPPNGDPNFKLFIIRGSPQQIDHAKQLIEDKIEGPLCPVGPGPGGPGPTGPMGPYNPNPYQPGPPGGPPHGGPPGGQYPQGWGSTYQQWQPHDPSKAAADHNAAWAAYYAQYYQQPAGGAMPGQTPAAQPAAPAPADQSQAAPGAAQPDYTKAWEEYYKKMAPCFADENHLSSLSAAAGGGAAPAAGGAQAPGAAAAGQTDYSAAWAEYYRQQAAYYGQTGQAAGQPGATPQGQQAQ